MASFWKPSRSVYIRQTINFNKINVSNRHVYYPVNTCVRIALTSSLIDGFSGTNCRHRCIQKALKKPLYYGSAMALLSPIYSRPYNRPYDRLYIVSTNGSASSLRTALQRLCNGSTDGSATALQMALQMALQIALQHLYERLYEWLCMALQRLYEWLCNGSIDSLLIQQS